MDELQWQFDPTPIITTQCMADIQPEAVQWLWPDRIALGKVTLLAGDPGLGKSIITVAMAAHISTGEHWPVDQSACPTGKVIMISAEDDPADTIRPRLDAAGADVRNIQVLNVVREKTKDRNVPLKDASFSLAKHVDGLDRLLEQTPDCRLVTIDPVSAYLGGTDSHNNADVRALLTPLAAMASKHKAAILIVTHLNKSAQANAIYRASGSLAFVAAARAAYSVTKDPDDPDRRLILPLKNNLGDDKSGFAYTITTAENGAPVLLWEPDPVEMSLEELASAVTERKPRPVELAKGWLQILLKNGPVLVVEIERLAKAADHAWRTVRRAKADLGIQSVKHRFDGQREWKLPDVSQDVRFLRDAATYEDGQ